MGTNGKFRATNGHERREGEIQNHEWTRMARKENSEPRMDTNGTTKHTKYTKGKLRTTNGHERTRMGNSEPRMDTNGHEWNHETHEKHEKRQGG